MKLVCRMLAGLLFLFNTPIAGASTPPLRIAAEAIQPHMTIDNDGNIYIVFIHKGNICVAVSQDKGKTFSRPVIVIDVGGRARGGRQRGPRIGVDTKGNLTVTAPVTFDPAEYEKRYPTADLYVVRLSQGGRSWSKPLRINEVPKKAPEALHWMAVAPTGEVHVAWLDLRSRNMRGQDIYYAKVVNGRVSKNVKIASTVCECCAPGLAVDGLGNPFIAFREGGSKPSREIFATSSPDRGGSFSNAVQVNQFKSMEAG